MITLGLDSGSTTTKAVLFDGQILAKELLPTGNNPRAMLEHFYQKYPADVVIVTGYGRDLLPVADRKVTEITCHARGAHYLAPATRTVIDIGGQDSKVMALDSHGKLQDFLMNDKCAAGTGKFLDVLMKVLHGNIEELDPFVRKAFPVSISSMCTVFAESEVIGMLANNIPPPEIARGVVQSIANRTATFAKRLDVKNRVFFSGGLSRSEVLRESIAQALGHEIISHEDAPLAGAIGAALIGWEKYGGKQKELLHDRQ